MKWSKGRLFQYDSESEWSNWLRPRLPPTTAILLHAGACSPFTKNVAVQFLCSRLREQLHFVLEGSLTCPRSSQWKKPSLNKNEFIHRDLTDMNTLRLSVDFKALLMSGLIAYMLAMKWIINEWSNYCCIHAMFTNLWNKSTHTLDWIDFCSGSVNSKNKKIV